MAQAQTQLTLFVDPQSLSLECEHGSGAEGSKCSLDQGPSPNLFISTVLEKTANAGQCRQAASRRRCESDPQSHKEATSMLNEKRSEKLTDEEMDEMIQRLTLTVVSVKRRTVKEIVEVVRSITTEAYSGNESQSRSWTCPCRKEQTVEAMKMIPQERVSKRIVKQIMDKSVPQVAGAERQGFSKPRNKLRTRRTN